MSLEWMETRLNTLKDPPYDLTEKMLVPLGERCRIQDIFQSRGHVKKGTVEALNNVDAA